MIQQPTFLTVKQVNTLIKDLLDHTPELMSLAIKGEVSNFRRYPKALYFTLKDQESKMTAVMFLYSTFPKYLPKDGDEVIVTGAVSVYVKEGQYQINVKQIEQYGLGDQLLALQKLKEKLAKEGLFDQAKKRPLPEYPYRVGFIAGQGSAALKDLTFNLTRRFPYAVQVFFPSLVQGNQAPQDLMRALNLAYQANLDVLIIARGGGAEEDLSAFNDEALVRHVAVSPIPTIAAIGHEINLSLVDLTADVRASTPTAAAELAVPDQEAIKQRLVMLEARIEQAISNQVQSYRERLRTWKLRPVLIDPFIVFHQWGKDLKKLDKALLQAWTLSMQGKTQEVKRLKETLLALSPKAVLNRGYHLSMKKDGTLITSIEALEVDETMTTMMQDGTIESIVKKKGKL